MAQSLYGNAGSVVKIDCSEGQHSHEITKLIGLPLGYLGRQVQRERCFL
jgi:ATP-dependent Clp protease ATP-binding subunit ClpA